MKPKPNAAARPRKAERGTKMIEVAVYFWTNDLPGEKHCRAKGKVKLVPNALHAQTRTHWFGRILYATGVL